MRNEWFFFVFLFFQFDRFFVVTGLTMKQARDLIVTVGDETGGGEGAEPEVFGEAVEGLEAELELEIETTTRGGGEEQHSALVEALREEALQRQGGEVAHSTLQRKVQRARAELRRLQLLDTNAAHDDSHDELEHFDAAAEAQGVPDEPSDEHQKTAPEGYFERRSAAAAVASFDVMRLSRPVLRAVAAAGWSAPTPIQASVMPVAMEGRDVCASAVTGSGKTAAFVVPIIERLLLSGAARDTRDSRIRVLILTPTRELAAQCSAVIAKLTAGIEGISHVLVVGGMSNKVRKKISRVKVCIQ